MQLLSLCILVQSSHWLKRSFIFLLSPRQKRVPLFKPFVTRRRCWTRAAALHIRCWCDRNFSRLGAYVAKLFVYGLMSDFLRCCCWGILWPGMTLGTAKGVENRNFWANALTIILQWKNSSLSFYIQFRCERVWEFQSGTRYIVRWAVTRGWFIENYVVPGYLWDTTTIFNPLIWRTANTPDWRAVHKLLRWKFIMILQYGSTGTSS